MEKTEAPKPKRKKNLKLVNKEEVSDNKTAAKKENDNIEIVFSAESKQALESGMMSKDLIRTLQKKVVEVTKEIQLLGEANKIILDVRMVFHARLQK